MSTTVVKNVIQYHRSKIWQIGLFTFNNTATNIYLFTLGFLSYYAAGIAGLAVLLISSILGAIRIFDGAIDPFIGALIDKLETKFGKYRPLMIIGNIILAISYLLIFSTHHLPEGARIAFLVVSLIIHKIGFSLQNSVTRAGQTVMTNDPKQRPLYAIFDGIYNIGVYVGGQVFVSSYLMGKHGNFTIDLFIELSTYAMVLSGILTLLALVGIWKNDKKEYYGLGEETVETKGLREYWKVIKGNRPLQMLTISAAADKIASQTHRQSVVGVMIFGILMGNYALSGTLSAIAVIPGVLITIFVTAIAAKTGLKKSYVTSVWVAIFAFAGMALLLLLGDPTSISLDNLGFMTIAFIALSILSGFVGMPTTLVVPMLADVSDYETSKSGRYVPGMMSTIFSFIDQLVSSLAPIIVGIVVAMIGFKDQFPTMDDVLTTPLLIAAVVLAYIIPVFCLIISLVCMKFYNLDKQKMLDVQEKINAMKQAGKSEMDETKKTDSGLAL